MAVIEPEEFGVSNSILLDNVSEESFVDNLKYRFARGRVSTTCVYYVMYHVYMIYLSESVFVSR